MIIDQTILSKYVRNTFRDKFSDNETLTSQYNNFECTFNIKIPNLDKNQKYKNTYMLVDDDSIIQVHSNTTNVIVTEENAIASKICFNIESSSLQSYAPSDYILQLDDLIDHVKKNIKQLVSSQIFKYYQNKKEYLLSIDYIDPVMRNRTLYKVSPQDTKIVFNSGSDDNDSKFIVVNNSKPYELENIVLEINNPGSQTSSFFSLLMGGKKETDTYIINSKKMTKNIRRIFPKETTIGHSMTIPYKTTECHVTVKELEFVDKEISINNNKKYSICGLITDKTQIKFNVPKENKSFIIDNDDNTDILKNPVEELEKHVGGIADEIKVVVRTICLSRGKLKKEFHERGLKAIKGIILHGPPGTGKTSLARNLGKLLGCQNERFRLMSGPEVFKKWVGSSEENIRKIFKPAKDAWKKYGNDAPTYMVVIDEIDAMLPSRNGSDGNPVRDSVVNQFLAEMDGLEQFNNLIVIGITNRLELLDPAATRSGRFGVHIKIDLPDNKARHKIFEIHTKKLKELKRLGNINFNKLVDQTNEYSGADIENIVGLASTLSLERLDKMDEINDEMIEKYGKVTESDFEKAISEISITKKKDDLKSNHMYI